MCVYNRLHSEFELVHREKVCVRVPVAFVERDRKRVREKEKRKSAVCLFERERERECV